MTSEESIKLDIISAYIGNSLTEEQKEFASNFKRDIISFSDPGTGKTHTLIAGLVMAQRYHKVPPQSINCMSFTNAATNEMAGRYQKLCKKLSEPTGVTFNTFHSLSRKILRDAYPAIRVVGFEKVNDAIRDLDDILTLLGLYTDDKRYKRKIIKAIDNLNSSLTFHPDHIAMSYDFVELDMAVEDFQEIRKHWFIRGITNSRIVQGDIPLYCLYALMSKPDMIEKWKGKYEIMVVDEFQDLSLLHLRILSYIANTLIVIGDMKQQIYAFNGACPQIVREYLKLHPNAVTCNLTRSFRCSNAISEFATRIIKPNDPTVEEFKGHDKESNVQFIPRKELDWKGIAEGILQDQKTNGIAKARDVMFLYRNNASAIPIIEELYQRGIAYRCTKLVTIPEMPMFESLTKLCNAAMEPYNIEKVALALSLFPEFQSTDYVTKEEPAPIEIMRKTGKSIFDVNYRYGEPSSVEILTAMKQARAAIEAKKSAGIVYMKVLEVYKKYILRSEWWKLDYPEDFYISLAAPVCNGKPYPLMINEEADKVAKNERNIDANMGIRLYTMHSAKGLEADDIWILDCDEGMFPNANKMKQKVNAGCLYSVAVDIRSERHLLYVAATRAKYNLYISYSGNEPCKLLTDPYCEEYHQFDEIYESNQAEFDDADEFFKLFRIGPYKVEVA